MGSRTNGLFLAVINLRSIYKFKLTGLYSHGFQRLDIVVEFPKTAFPIRKYEFIQLTSLQTLQFLHLAIVLS